MTDPEANKAVVRRFIDALRAGDVATAAACFDGERYYSHAWEADLAGTWEKMKTRRRELRFTEWQSETVVLVADGDRVVHHSYNRVVDATTGKHGNLHDLEIWRLENGLIVEHWGGREEHARFERQLE